MSAVDQVALSQRINEAYLAAHGEAEAQREPLEVAKALQTAAWSLSTAQLYAEAAPEAGGEGLAIVNRCVADAIVQLLLVAAVTRPAEPVRLAS